MTRNPLEEAARVAMAGEEEAPPEVERLPSWMNGVIGAVLLAAAGVFLVGLLKLAFDLAALIERNA
ncbi:MAG: hypothetical protein AB7O88_28495 [Reyranellaceae bacterium]